MKYRVLCEQTFTDVIKIVSNKLKIVPLGCGDFSQTSFILRRNTSNNKILAQEVVHSMKIKKEEIKGFMVVIVDLEKTCDGVCWDFLKDTLVNVRFGQSLELCFF